MKRQRKYNHSKVRAGYPYDYKEICNLFNVDISTVRRMRQQGLEVIDPNRKPCLVLGKELIRFLKKRKSDRKIKLKSGEFNCRKCRAARRSVNNRITIVMSGILFSKGNHKAEIIGKCHVCDSQVQLFSSERIIKKMISNSQILLDQGIRLKWTTGNAINARFRSVYYE